MNFYAITALINFIATLALGVFVFSVNPKNKTNQTYALANLSVAFWAFFYFFWQTSSSYDNAFLFLKLLMFGATFMPTFLFHFLACYLGIEKQNRGALLLVYFVSITFFILNASNMLFSSLSSKLGFPYWPNASVAMNFYLLFFFGFISYGLYLLYRSYIVAGGAGKTRISYLFFGLLFAVLAGSPNYFLWYNIPIPPFLNPLFLVYVGIISYAILTQRLMDIEVVIKKGIVYSALSILMAAIYFSTLYLSEYVFRRITGLSSLWAAIPLVIVFSLLIQPLRERIQGVVDNLFFKARYDYQKILSRYSNTLKKPTTNLDRFLKIAPYLIRKSMKLSGASMLIFNRPQDRYDMRAGEGTHKELSNVTISDNFEVVKELLRSGEPLIFDDVKQSIREAEADAEKEKWERIKQEMTELKANLLIPSISKSEYFKHPVLLAIFDFGEKLSEDAFSGSDIEFLETIARQASIVIEYAFILEELRRDEQQIVTAEKFAALGTMAGSVVSALKGPIEDMEKYSQSMTKKFDDQKFREGFTKDIPNDITRLDRVVNDLLIYARPMKLNLSEVKLNDVVQKAVDLLKIKEMKEHVAVKEDFSETPSIQADPQQLLNALMRLFAYAIAAARGEINVSTGPEDGHVALTIEIPRSFIPRESLAKIFTSYYSPKEGEGGLELATAAKIIREHKGEVTVESNQTVGTRIVAAMPV